MINLYIKYSNKLGDARQAIRNADLDPLDVKDDVREITWETPLMVDISKPILSYWKSTDPNVKKTYIEELEKKSAQAERVRANKNIPIEQRKKINSFINQIDGLINDLKTNYTKETALQDMYDAISVGDTKRREELHKGIKNIFLNLAQDYLNYKEKNKDNILHDDYSPLDKVYQLIGTPYLFKLSEARDKYYFADISDEDIQKYKDDLIDGFIKEHDLNKENPADRELIKKYIQKVDRQASAIDIDWYPKFVYPIGANGPTKPKKPNEIFEDVSYNWGKYDGFSDLSVQFPNGYGLSFPFGNPALGNQPSNLPFNHGDSPVYRAYFTIASKGGKSARQDSEQVKKDVEIIAKDIIENYKIWIKAIKALKDIKGDIQSQNKQALQLWRDLEKSQTEEDFKKFSDRVVADYDRYNPNLRQKLKNLDRDYYNASRYTKKDFERFYIRIGNEIEQLKKDIASKNIERLNIENKHYNVPEVKEQDLHDLDNEVTNIQNKIKELEEKRKNPEEFKKWADNRSQYLEDRIEKLDDEYIKPTSTREEKPYTIKSTISPNDDIWTRVKDGGVNKKDVFDLINNKFNPLIIDRWGNTYKIKPHREEHSKDSSNLNENFNLVITMKEQEKPILKMIKCINEGKMKTANKYLQEAVEINLKHRIKQAIKTVENK